MNIYKDILSSNLPRLLSCYNLDRGSDTYGYGDRLFWGWKISDFPNGTMQCGVHALSIAIKMGLVENEEFYLDVVDASVMAIERIMDRNGSLVEAYPGESSFCVTALVAFDVLSSIRILGRKLSTERVSRYLGIIGRLIGFIEKNDEHHAIISNHLATAAAAVTLWKAITGETLGRDKELLDLIYRHQSDEGWFLEYESADQGYQTLCTHYLASIFNVTGDEELGRRLERSGAYLKYFVHPDGTIGGLYGSRNTEVYYPGGIVCLSETMADFAQIAKGLEAGIKKQHHILPDSIDPGNYFPLLNSYATAAYHFERCKNALVAVDEQQYESNFQKTFEDSGIFICSTPAYYSITNYKKGGTLKVFEKGHGHIEIEDGGICGKMGEKKFSTQHYDPDATFENHEIAARFCLNNESYPSPLTTILLRGLGLTVFRFLFLGNLFKKIIVKMLMTGKRQAGGLAVRKFIFEESRIHIHETIRPASGLKGASFRRLGRGRSIHMASSGYYLKQIEQEAKGSEMVSFTGDLDRGTGV